MDLNALSSLIAAMRPSFRSPEQQQLDTLINLWAIALGEPIASHSRPMRYERHSLTIAVRQAIWAQQLTAQTHQILQQLRPQLPPQLTIETLRFRVAPQFCRDPDQASNSTIPQTQNRPQPHPSHWPIPSLDLGLDPSLDSSLDSSLDPELNPKPNDKLKQVVDRWRLRLEHHAPALSSCPQCQCLTPPAELDRWQMCALCATALFWSPMALGGQSPPPPETKPEQDEELGSWQ